MGHMQPWAAGGNFLLASLPDPDRALLSRHLEPVSLERNVALYDPDVVMSHVYFPDLGLVSLLAVLADGTGVETAIIGREGMVGMPVFHRTERMAEQAVVQLPGSAQRMTAASLRTCLEESAALREALHHYSACVFMFAAQSVACMNKHEISRRLARWLLHAADHSGMPDLAFTHLFLSHMLGVRRSSVSVAASALRGMGMIDYSRKTIQITDRDALVEYSCECYRIVRSTYDRLIFGTPSPSPLDGVEISRGGLSTVGSPHGDNDDGEPRDSAALERHNATYASAPSPKLVR
jgi:CRP-like cAMP-binding protein